MVIAMIAVRMMQVAIHQIVDVIATAKGGVPAVRAVLVVVMGMVRFTTGSHMCLLLRLAVQKSPSIATI